MGALKSKCNTGVVYRMVCTGFFKLGQSSTVNLMRVDQSSALRDQPFIKLLRTIFGLIPHVSGSILLDGQALLKMRPHQIPALGVVHVRKGRHVFYDMTAKENLMLDA